MPIEAADALKIFIESLTNFAKLHKNSSEVRLSVKEGSIETILEYPQSLEIDTEIDEIIEGTSENREYAKLIRTIQDKIRLNGFNYTVKHTVNNEVRDLTDVFKSRPFVIKRPRIDRREKVVFIEGHIYETGGKVKPNMHIDSGKEDFTVSFKREIADKLPSLYGHIYLSALKKEAIGRDEISYELIDRYLTQELYEEYKNLYESIQETKDSSRFRRVFDFIEENFNREDGGLGRIMKLMRLYNFAQSDKGVLRSILMMIKPVKEVNPEINAAYIQLADNLRLRSKNQII
ncbi:MAG: hypothetical protein ACO1O1_13235 [Adhaeribacter sp.]